MEAAALRPFSTVPGVQFVQASGQISLNEESEDRVMLEDLDELFDVDHTTGLREQTGARGVTTNTVSHFVKNLIKPPNFFVPAPSWTARTSCSTTHGSSSSSSSEVEQQQDHEKASTRNKRPETFLFSNNLLEKQKPSISTSSSSSLLENMPTFLQSQPKIALAQPPAFVLQAFEPPPPMRGLDPPEGIRVQRPPVLQRPDSTDGITYEELPADENAEDWLRFANEMEQELPHHRMRADHTKIAAASRQAAQRCGYGYEDEQEDAPHDLPVPLVSGGSVFDNLYSDAVRRTRRRRENVALAAENQKTFGAAATSEEFGRGLRSDISRRTNKLIHPAPEGTATGATNKGSGASSSSSSGASKRSVASSAYGGDGTGDGMRGRHRSADKNRRNKSAAAENKRSYDYKSHLAREEEFARRRQERLERRRQEQEEERAREELEECTFRPEVSLSVTTARFSARSTSTRRGGPASTRNNCKPKVDTGLYDNYHNPHSAPIRTGRKLATRTRHFEDLQPALVTAYDRNFVRQNDHQHVGAAAQRNGFSSCVDDEGEFELDMITRNLSDAFDDRTVSVEERHRSPETYSFRVPISPSWQMESNSVLGEDGEDEHEDEHPVPELEVETRKAIAHQSQRGHNPRRREDRDIREEQRSPEDTRNILPDEVVLKALGLSPKPESAARSAAGLEVQLQAAESVAAEAIKKKPFYDVVAEEVESVSTLVDMYETALRARVSGRDKEM
ncbi:unnamed protein product [Amoebophrya sp. A120]|nr:unnamed protein product [Amoebophrya sp. A120]|eukprot:GSA120T00005112001.1